MVLLLPVLVRVAVHVVNVASGTDLAAILSSAAALPPRSYAQPTTRPLASHVATDVTGAADDEFPSCALVLPVASLEAT